MFYLTAGTYGTLESRDAKKLKEQSKLSFWMQNIFIKRSEMAHRVPFTAKSPLLYPVGVIWRCCRVLIKRRDRLKKTISAVKKYGK